jgi:Endonuclease/Exonuclease/phosphatase family
MSISRATKTQAPRKCYVHAKGQGTFGSSLLDFVGRCIDKTNSRRGGRGHRFRIQQWRRVLFASALWHFVLAILFANQSFYPAWIRDSTLDPWWIGTGIKQFKPFVMASARASQRQIFCRALLLVVLLSCCTSLKAAFLQPPLETERPRAYRQHCNLVLPSHASRGKRCLWDAATFVVSGPTILKDSGSIPCAAQTLTRSRSVNVVAPGRSFRNTVAGEVSILSYNVLAPSYFAIGSEKLAVGLNGETSCPPSVQESMRAAVAKQDRLVRFPQAIELAKAHNADILCLQEVEGGPEFEPRLQELLSSSSANQQGYDAMVFSALHPNRSFDRDVVGLCVAWRSSRHRLVSVECFRRGMVVQFCEVLATTTDNGDSLAPLANIPSTFVVGNVHLPAKPSAIEGRLRSVASAVRRMEALEANRSPIPNGGPDVMSHPVFPTHSALDGAFFMVGDFNCDHLAAPVSLLKTGYGQHGTLKDRNYKVRISKQAAANMKHGLRFRDVYEASRPRIAPITVSLRGRGPGTMDQVLFATTTRTKQSSQRCQLTAELTAIPEPAEINGSIKRDGKGRGRGVGGATKRQSRRDRLTNRLLRRSFGRGRSLNVEAILATVFESDGNGLSLIKAGLPNLSAGFPSDHLPVGALFSPTIEPQREPPSAVPQRTTVLLGLPSARSGLTTNARRRRESFQISAIVRRRHNSIVRYIVEWLLGLGATNVIRDQPLYKWPWTSGIAALQKKMRAPDVCCVVGGNTLVIIEVTVTSMRASRAVREEKASKYGDLQSLLSQSPSVQQRNLTVAEPFVLVFLDENAGPSTAEESESDATSCDMVNQVPSETRAELHRLLQSVGRLEGCSEHNQKPTFFLREASSVADEIQELVSMFSTA